MTRRAAPKEEDPCLEIPPDAPPIPHSPRSGTLAGEYRYGWALVVAKYLDKKGEKTFRQWTWHARGWIPAGHPGPLPVYGIELLHKFPDAPVLIVEGEACCEAARALLRPYVVVTWAGGAGATRKTDWSALAGREITIWPDADEVGWKAGTLIAEDLDHHADKIRLVDTHGQPAGWDLGDAIADGWGQGEIVAFIQEHGRVLDKPKKNGTAAPAADYLPAPGAGEELPDYPMEVLPRSALMAWHEIGLKRDSKDVPVVTLSNASLIIQNHPDLKGKIWFDTFQERIMHTLRSTIACEWGDQDSRRMAIFIQQTLDLPKFNLALVNDAILHAAHEHARNSVTAWLDSLAWDGTERLTTWVGDCLGVSLDEYSMAVGRNWIISMVARAYVPGCQVDTMPVLEGTQGRGKSSAIEILGGEWFTAASSGFGSLEFIEEIQGKWLVEIPDMASFQRRDHGHIISTITKRVDRYRSKYGRFSADHPRRCVFAATSETDDYLPEMRGIRRYWPLRCGQIDLDSLRMQREQLFAEAVHVYRTGGKHHEMPADETVRQQQMRAVADEWTEDVMKWAAPMGQLGKPVYPPDILRDVLGFHTKELTRANGMRVSTILKSHGWVEKTVGNLRQYVKPLRQENDPSRGSGD